MLHSIEMQSVETVGDYAFASCTNLMTLSLPNAKNVRYSVCYNAIVDHLSLPSVQNIWPMLTNTAAEVDLGMAVTMSYSAFYKDYNLSALIIRTSSVCTLMNSTAFNGTPIASGTGYIYVPNALLGAYKEATNWAFYERQIVSLDEYPIDVSADTITDSWSDIFASEEDGTYATKYSVGDTKSVSIGKFKIPMQIIAMNTDELANENGNAKITWLSLNVAFNAQMHPNDKGSGGWEVMPLRTGLMQTLYDHMDSVVRSGIKNVKKTFYDDVTQSTKFTADYIWIPSYREIIGDTTYEDTGCTYASFFSTLEKKIKRGGATGIGKVAAWWLRTIGNGSSAFYNVVGDLGSTYTYECQYFSGVVFGFCT